MCDKFVKSGCIEKFKRLSVPERIFTLVMAVLNFYLLYVVIGYYVRVIGQTYTYHIPIEYRDGSVLSVARAFCDFKNPYSLTYNSTLNTPLIYQYSFIIPLMIAGIHLVTGIDLITCSVVLNFITVVSTTIILVAALSKSLHKKLYWLTPTILIYVIRGYSVFYNHNAGLTVRGESIGILFTAIVILLFITRSENTTLISIFSVLLFYTKPTFVIVAFPIFIFYLVENRKNALKYFLKCMLMGIISLILVRLIFPMFFTESIYYLLGATLNRGDFSVAINIYSYLISSNHFTVNLGVISSIIFFIDAGVGLSRKGFKLYWKDRKYAVFAFVFFVVGMLMLDFGKMSCVMGDGYKYVNSQIFIPLLFMGIYSVNMIIEFMPLIMKKTSGNVLNIVKLVFVGVLVVRMSFCGFKSYSWNVISDEDVSEWEELYQLCSEYDLGRIYLDPLACTYLFSEDIDFERCNYDGGHTEYCKLSADVVGDSIRKYIFNESCEIDELIARKDLSIVDRVAEGYFDLIIITENTETPNFKDIEKNYVKMDEIHLESYLNGFNFYIYERRD